MEQELSELKADMKEIRCMLRTLVATDNKMKELRTWQLDKMDQRCRQKTCRSKKAAEEEKRPENPVSHCLINDFDLAGEFLYTKPTCWDAMTGFLKTNLKCDPVPWFVYKVRESARDALTFLFCLYNNSFQQKWVKNSGPPYTVLRGWEAGVTPRTPDWKRDVPKSTMFPAKVPKGEWSQPSREAYSDCWCWKVFATVYKFLQEFILEEDVFENSEDDQIKHFLRVVPVMSEMSDFEVFPKKFWAPFGICDTKEWTEKDAKRACHLVAPELAILIETFRKGFNKNITDYF